MIVVVGLIEKMKRMRFVNEEEEEEEEGEEEEEVRDVVVADEQMEVE